MGKKYLHADKHENYSSRKFGFRLIFIAENVSDFKPFHREYTGNRADKGNSKPDINVFQPPESDARSESVDTRGDRENEHRFKRKSVILLLLLFF